tara:strand:+ start:622 stop:1263 length:642 start_codon:yes stop_codon:yes gene_type:complete
VSSLKDIRTDYTKGKLNPDEMSSCPAEQLARWVDEAAAEGVGDPNAFCLSTIQLNGAPTGRIVLARRIDERGVVFYTNKLSSKGEELGMVAKAGATFFWSEMQRQVRLSGEVSHLSDREADEYFNSRPKGSRIGAWASEQSKAMSSREELEKRVAEYEEKFAGGDDVPRPPHWGGYLVSIDEIEFWQGRASRLHDRVKYVKEAGSWRIELLQP